MPVLVAAVLLVAMPAMAADETGKPAVVAFNSSVRVEVDASGTPVKVEAPADLPEAIRSYIHKRVASWQYQPAKVDGVPVSAVTYVRVGACAMPVAEGYRLGLDFKGNGPKIIAAGDRMGPPTYPFEAQRKGLAGTFKVSYVIQPDGSTRLDAVETLEGGNKLAKLFHPALAQWIEGMRYEPEQVNGRPVATTMNFPVEFFLDHSHRNESPEAWRERYRKELQDRAIASKECLAATVTDGLVPVALDSPVKVTPRPAG